MRKNTLFSIIALLSGATGYSVHSATKTAIPAPKPPFVSQTELKVTTFKTKQTLNSFVAGGKALKISNSGRITFIASGQKIANIFFPFRIYNNKDKSKKLLMISSNWPSRYFKKSKDGLNSSKGQISFTKTISEGGSEARITGTMKLLDDGRIQLTYEWTKFDSNNLRLIPSSLHIEVPQEAYHGCSYSVNGKNYPIPEHVASQKIEEIKGFKDAVLFTGKPKQSLEVKPVQTSGSFVLAIGGKKSGARFRIGASYRKTSFSVIFDISKGVNEKASKDKYAGIDFMRTENLEMPDYSASKNLISNPSFERGLESYWHYGTYSRHVDLTKMKWQMEPFVLDTKTAKFGTNCLKLTCSARNRDFRWIGYHIRTMPIPLSPGKYTFSIYAKGEKGKKQRLSVWVTNVNWLGNRHLPVNSIQGKKGGSYKVFNLTDQWKRYTLSFSIPESMPASVSFGSDSADGTGYTLVDGLQLEKNGKATEFASRLAEGWLKTSREGNFLDVKDKIDGKLQITTSPGMAGKATVTVKDFFGNEVFRQSNKFKADAKGKATMPLALDGKLPQGIFVVKAQYDLANGEKCYDLHRLSIMKFLDGTHRLREIFTEDYSVPYNRADFLKILKRQREIGIGSRIKLPTWKKAVWDEFRKNKIRPTYASIFNVLRKIKKSDKPCWVISNPPDISNLKANDPRIVLGPVRFDADGKISEAYLAELKKVLTDIVRKHPWVSGWTLGNETLSSNPIAVWSAGGSRKRGFENLAKFHKTIYEAVKAGNPKANVHSDEPSNMSPERGTKDLGEELAALNRIGGPKLDYIGIHPYRATPESPDLDAATKTFLEMLKKNGYDDTPISWSEGMHYAPYNIPQWNIKSACWVNDTWTYGALSYDMGWTEKISAAWRARSWLVALKYQDRVKAFMSGAQLNNFEMDVELTPFATQKISNTLSNLLGDAYFKADIRFAPYIRCYIFEDEKKRPVAAVWCYHPQLDAGKMAAPVAAVKLGDKVEGVFDLMQVECACKPNRKGVFEFPVTSFPVFFRGKPGTLKDFVKAFNNASMVSGDGIAPVAIIANPVSPSKAALKARNFLSRPLNGVIKMSNGESTKLNVPGSGIGQAALKMPVALTYNKLLPENLQLDLVTAKNKFSWDAGFVGLLCKQTKKDFKLDCNLDAWKDIPAVKITNRIYRAKKTKIAPKDFSAWFKVAWSSKGLNLLVKVTDDNFFHDKMKKDVNRWNNDCLQIYVDSQAEARWRQQKNYGDSEYDYAIFPAPDGSAAMTFRYRQPDPQLSGLATTAPQNNAPAPEIPSAFKKTSDGYIYQVFIPAKCLLPARMEKGYVFGFALVVNDRESGDAKRESSLVTTPHGVDAYNNPKQWPVLLLWD